MSDRMSDQRTGRDNAHGDELHSLPPDAQGIYRQLEREGAAWRAQTRELEGVGQRLHERAQQLTRDHYQSQMGATTRPASAYRTRAIDVSRLDTRTSISRRTTARIPAPTRPPIFARRVGGALAAVAAMAIVGAVAALLLTSAPGGSVGPGHPGQTTVPSGRWVSLDPLAADVQFDANDLPAIAPSDPHVVYETLVYGIQQGQPGTLRRTDDGGATWHDLPIPVPAADVGHAGFLVSPLDAHMVFLSLVDTHAADCPPGTAQPMTEAGSGAVLCWIQYSSTDGGAHWTLTKLPAPGTLTPNLTNNSGTSVSAGHDPGGKVWLYALLNCPGAQLCSRLVRSDDGLTWQYADSPLLSEGAQNVCATTADTRGTAVYAVTIAAKGCDWLEQQPLTLWRSDDAGLHWLRLGPLATPNIRGMLVAHGSGKALLYAAEPRTTQMATDKMGGKYPLFSSDPADVKVQTDGSATWVSAPSAGIPAGMRPYYDIGLLGTLSDGSVVVQFVPTAAEDNFNGGTLFAWKPGDAAWRQLAPPLTWEVGSLTAVPVASGSPGSDTLYLVMTDRSGNYASKQHATYSFLRYDR